MKPAMPLLSKGPKPTARKTHAHKRGAGAVAPKIKGDKVHAFADAGKTLFQKRAKATEPDSVGRKPRPAAHDAKQSGEASRARARVKRLSDQVI